MSIKAQEVSYLYGKKLILNKVDIEILPGEILGIVGPNGSGKSTILKLLAGDFYPSKGQIKYDNKNIKSYSNIDRAKYRSVLSQSQEIVFEYTVQEIIEMGIIGGFGINHHIDTWKNFEYVIDTLELKSFLKRSIRTLSGGERQRVHIARSIIQIWQSTEYEKPRYILLDEPTSSLDLGMEIKILEMLKKEAKKGLGIMIIFHDLNLTSHFSDKVAILSNGKILESGIPSKVFKPILIDEVFRIKTSITKNPLRIFHF